MRSEPNNSTTDLRSRASEHLLASAEVKRNAAERCAGAIAEAAELIGDAFRAGRKVLLCGNGGSAADCQHMAAELVSSLSTEFVRSPLPAVALTTDTSFLTAYANDFGYDGIFERQVLALGHAGDVLIGISTSGGSRNIVRAVEAARGIGMRVVTLTGRVGPLLKMADVAITVPSTDTQHTQEAHIAIEHVLCHLVEMRLFTEPDSTSTARL